MKSDYEKIINKFGFDDFYTKQQVIEGLKDAGIIKDEKGLLNKIKGEFSLRKTYHHGNHELEFMYIKRRKLYRIVIWDK